MNRYEHMEWIQLPQDKIQCKIFVKTVIILEVPYKLREFLYQVINCQLLKKTLYLGITQLLLVLISTKHITLKSSTAYLNH